LGQSSKIIHQTSTSPAEQSNQNYHRESTSCSIIQASLSPLYKHLKILKFKDIIKVQIAKLTHHFYTSKIPLTYCNLIKVESTHNYRTRHAQESIFKKPNASTELGKKSFSFKGPKIWNEIPDNLKDQSFNSFKSKLKKSTFWNHINKPKCINLIHITLSCIQQFIDFT